MQNSDIHNFYLLIKLFHEISQNLEAVKFGFLEQSSRS